MTFCLYVASRVFVQYLKSRPRDGQVKASLHFLITVMNIIKRRNPSTESFLVQLDVDLQNAGLEESRSLRTRLAKKTDWSTGCWAGGTKGDSGIPGETSASSSPGQIWNQTGRTERPVFGDLGLAAYSPLNGQNLTKPPQQDPTDKPCSKTRAYDSEQSNSSRIDRTYSIPSRQKTPSSNLSPYSEDVMDFQADLVELSSTDSRRNEFSHDSTTSYTPPSVSQDPGQVLWDASMGSEKRAVYLGELQPLESDYWEQNNSAEFATSDRNFGFEEPFVGTFAKQHSANLHASQSNGGDGPGQVTGTGLTPGAMGSFAAASGLTPGQSGGLLDMSEAEWKQMLDDGLMDMGWQSNMVTDTGGFDFVSRNL